MIKSNSLQNLNIFFATQTFQSEEIAHDRTSMSSTLRQTFIKALSHLESKFVNLIATKINNNALRGRLE